MRPVVRGVCMRYCKSDSFAFTLCWSHCMWPRFLFILLFWIHLIFYAIYNANMTSFFLGFPAAVLLCILHQSLAHLSSDSERGGAELHPVPLRDLQCMPCCGKGQTGKATLRSCQTDSFAGSETSFIGLGSDSGLMKPCLCSSLIYCQMCILTGAASLQMK